MGEVVWDLDTQGGTRSLGNGCMLGKPLNSTPTPLDYYPPPLGTAAPMPGCNINSPPVIQLRLLSTFTGTMMINDDFKFWQTMRSTQVLLH